MKSFLQLNKKITPLTKEEILQKIQNDFKDYFQYKAATKDNFEHLECIFKKRIEEYFIGNNIPGNIPFFKHNCPKCTYLGDYIKISFDEGNGVVNIGYYDLYAHMRENTVNFIARYGDSLDDYFSFTYFVCGEFEEQKKIMQSIDGIYEAFTRYGDRCRPKPPKGYPRFYE